MEALPRRPRADGVAKLGVADAAPERARRHVLVAAAAVALQVVALVGLNLAVDPRDEFGTDWFRPAVPDEVSIQLQRLEDASPPPEHAVLGSSRARMVLGLPGEREATINLALHGGSIEDSADLFAYLLREGPRPDTVLVVVDQGSFTAAFPSRIPASPAAAEVTGEEPGLGHFLRLAVGSLDASYVYDTVRSVRYSYTGYPPLRLEEPEPVLAEPDLMERYRNGTFDPASLGRGIDRQMSIAFGPGTGLVQARRAAFEGLVAEARARGVGLVLVMPPIHPVALADYEARLPEFAPRVQQLRDALYGACGPGVHAFDYTRIESFGGGPAWFFDQTHPSRENVALMEDAMGRGVGDLCAAGAGE